PAFNGWASNITVCNAGETKSIQQGIRLALDGDTVLVKSRIYKEFNIIIDKSIVLLGENLPTIDGQKKGEIIKIHADNVTVDGFKIINVGSSYTSDFAAVRVVKKNGFLIQNLQLENLFFGIYLEKSNNGKVLNNKISGNAINEYNSGNGIQLWYCKNVEVIGN